MVLILRVLAVVVTVLSIYIFAPWQQGLYYLSPLPDSIEKQVDEAIEQGIDGIIVYVDAGNEEPKLYASGIKERSTQTPARADALFKMASIGKLYEALAVAKLSAMGKISLDKTIADYLPHVAGRIANSEKITIKMLVQHRSGLANYTDHDNFSWAEPFPNTYELILDTESNFEPDTDYQYSNTNYFLLKQIMSAVLGYDYKKFIEQEILTPLELEQTYLSMADVDLSKMVSGYHLGYEHDFKELSQGYVATAENIGRFIRALNNGRAFSNEAERKVYQSLYRFSHDGWVIGYISKTRYFKENDTVIVQFINTTGNDTILLADIVFDRISKLISEK